MTCRLGSSPYRKVFRVSPSKLEELSVFPPRPFPAPDLSRPSAMRLLDELSGAPVRDEGRPIPEFSPELRSRVLDLVAGTCRKGGVS